MNRVNPAPSRALRLRPPHLRLAALGLLLLCSISGLLCAADAARDFDLPAGQARDTLKRFAAQAQVEIVFPSENTLGVATNAVRGRLSPEEAITALLAGTNLTATREPKTGAYSVRPRPSDPNGPRAAPSVSSDRPSVSAVPGSGDAERREQVVQLSTFTVREEPNLGYESMQTTAGMRTVQELRNVSNSISIVNAQLIEDTAALSMDEISRWFVSGEDNPEPAGTAASRVILRGIPNAFAMRNGWVWYSAMDSYTTERVELLRGPNAFLYGEADIGGAQNQITKHGLFTRSFTKLKVMGGDDALRRVELDLNRPLLKDRLALRFTAVQHNNGSWMDNQRKDFRGLYGAITYRPTRQTQISIMGEHAKNTAVLSQGLWNDAFSRTAVSTIGATAGYVYVPAAKLMYRAQGTGRVQSTGTGTTVVDPAVAPKELQTNGPNATYKNYYDSLTIEAEHRIGSHLLLQVTGNFYQQLIDNWVVGSGRNVYRDMNRTLPSGQLNPYYGELYTEYYRGRNINGNVVRDIRFSAAYDWATKWTSQTFLVNVQQHQDTPGQYKPKWGEFVDPTSSAWAGAQPSQAITQAAYTATRTLFNNNRLMRRYYFLREGVVGSEEMGPVPDVSGWFPDVSAAGQQLWRRFYTPSWGAGASGSWFKEHLFTHLGYRRDKFNMKTTLGTVRPLRDTWIVDYIDGAFAPNPSYVNVKVDGSNAGAIFRINDAVAFGYNWAQSFRISSGEGSLTHRVGERQGVGVGEGQDLSARFSLLPDGTGLHRLEVSVVRYHNFRPNDRFNPNPNVDVEQEVTAIFPETFNPTGQDYQTTTTNGYEIELMANLTRNWRSTFNFATNKVMTENRAPILKSFQADARALGRTTPLLDAFLQTIPEGVPNAGYTKERANFFTRYTFATGRLRGLYLGAGLNYRLRTYRGVADLDGIAATPPTAMWSPAYTLYSALAGYQRMIYGRTASLALNIGNIFNKEYYRSGGIASGSWGDPRSFRLSLTTEL